MACEGLSKNFLNGIQLRLCRQINASDFEIIIAMHLRGYPYPSEKAFITAVVTSIVESKLH
jgi:hypothetical protein